MVVSVALQRARDDAGALRTAALVLRLVRTLADGGAGAPGVWLLTAGALGGGGGGARHGGLWGLARAARQEAPAAALWCVDAAAWGAATTARAWRLVAGAVRAEPEAAVGRDGGVRVARLSAAAAAQGRPGTRRAR